jgi:hypothetical protein
MTDNHTRLSAIAVTFSGPAEVVLANVGAIRAWLEDYAAFAHERGWTVTIQSNQSALRYSKPNLARALARATGGAGRWLVLGVGADPDHPVSSFTWRPSQRFPRGWSAIDFATQFDEPKLLRYEQWRDHALRLGESSGVVQGLAITPAMPERYRYDMTPMEMRRIALGPKGLKRYLRQPAWALWLTECHIDALGGRDRLRREAPVHLVVERERGMWVELTDDPLEIPVGRWTEFEAYLAPVLANEEQVRAADPPNVPEAVVVRRQPIGGQPTLDDAYPNYTGPPTSAIWMTTAEDSLGIHVELGEGPSDRAADSLNRAIVA